MTRLKLLFSTAKAIVKLLWLLFWIGFATPFFIAGYVFGIGYRGVHSGFTAAHDL